VLILLAFAVAIRSVSGMQNVPDDAPVPAAVHRAVVAKLDALTIAFEKPQLQFQALLRQRFGVRGESIDQLQLFGTDDVEFIEREQVSAPPAAVAKKPTNRDRVALPRDLPVEREVIDVPEADKLAADGTPLKPIGDEITIKLGYRPAAFFKREIVRPKYADPRAPQAGVTIAPLPAQLLDGSLLDASLGAHLLVSKYGDHLPLYRLEDIYARGGVPIPRSTLCDWVIALADRWLLEHPAFAVIEPVIAFVNDSMKDWIERRLEPECEVYSDGLGCFRRLAAGHAHTTLKTGGGRAATEATGARWVNVVLANAKRAISGV
jgi:transposase